jgi:flagellar basal-body rod modification protein FlgD
MLPLEVDASTTGGSLLSSTPSRVLDKDDFLNLLITQLQNQDPLNPTDSVEFTAQLAQFSSLEQLGNVNDNLTEMKNFQASINNSQAVSLIGKTITANGDSIQLGSDRPVPCNFKLQNDAAVVVASIYDGTGKFVADFKTENLAAGPHSLMWEGTDNAGRLLPNGDYSFKIQAADASGRDIGATTFFTGKVDKVAFDNNTSYLISGNHKVALGEIVEVASSENINDVSSPEADSTGADTQSSNPSINGGK